MTEVTLNTDRRAEERQDWESQVAEMQSEVEAQRHAAERQRILQEEEEYRRSRAQAVHKANPIRNYKPMEINPSDKPLTNPQTPRFSDRLKSRAAKC